MPSEISPLLSDLEQFARLLKTLEEIRNRAGQRIIVDRTLKANHGLYRFFAWSTVKWPITSEDAYQARDTFWNERSRKFDISNQRVWIMGEWFFEVKRSDCKMTKRQMAEAWATIILRLPQPLRFAANRVLNGDLQSIERGDLQDALDAHIPF